MQNVVLNEALFRVVGTFIVVHHYTYNHYPYYSID